MAVKAASTADTIRPIQNSTSMTVHPFDTFYPFAGGHSFGIHDCISLPGIQEKRAKEHRGAQEKHKGQLSF